MIHMFVYVAYIVGLGCVGFEAVEMGHSDILWRSSIM